MRANIDIYFNIFNSNHSKNQCYFFIINFIMPNFASKNLVSFAIKTIYFISIIIIIVTILKFPFLSTVTIIVKIITFL